MQGNGSWRKTAAVNPGGGDFEYMLSQEFAMLQKRGIASAEKVDPPTKVFGGRVIHMKNPFLDYVGTWTAEGGRMLMLEAKSTKRALLPLDEKGLKPDQLTTMKRWLDAGAVSACLWEHAGMVRIVTYEMAITAKKRGQGSIPFEDAYVVQKGAGIYVPDFLGLLKVLFALTPLST